MLHIGQGDVLVGARAADGSVSSWRNVGEAPIFEVNITSETIKDRETSSGMRRQILSVVTGQEAEVTITFKEPTAENLAFLCYGTEQSVAGLTLTNEAMPNGLVAGVWYQLPKDVAGVVSVVVRDSTGGTPITLAADGTHYELDATFGLIKFTSAGITGKVQPFKVSCVAGNEQGVSLMDRAPVNVAVRLNGINLADENRPEIWTLYNVQVSPPDKLPGKGENVAELTVKGSVLIDPKKPKGGKWGQFGNIRRITPAVAA